MNTALNDFKIFAAHHVYELVVLVNRAEAGPLPRDLPIGRARESLLAHLKAKGLVPDNAAIAYEERLVPFPIPDSGVPGVRLPPVEDWGGTHDIGGHLPACGLRSLKVTLLHPEVSEFPGKEPIGWSAPPLVELAEILDAALQDEGLGEVVINPVYWGPAHRMTYMTYLDACLAALVAQSAYALSQGVGPVVAVASHHGALTEEGEPVADRSHDCVRVAFYDWADRLMTGSEYVARGVPLENLSERLVRGLKELTLHRAEIHPRKSSLIIDGQAYVVCPLEGDHYVRPH